MTDRIVVTDEPNVVLMPAQKTDAEVAAEFRARAEPLIDGLAAVVEEAKRKGMILSWDMSPNAFGTTVRKRVDILKQIF